MIRVPGRTAVAVLILGGAMAGGWGAMPQDRPAEVRIAPAETAPYVTYGRRILPGENDPFFVPGPALDALGERLERAGDEAERARLAYTLLIWHVYSIVAVEQPEDRRRLYTEAERLYLGLLARNAKSRPVDPALEGDAHFFIGLAWVAWKGSLDPLARERLERCSSLKAGHYRLAAEMLVEKAASPPSLDVAIDKLKAGDARTALDRLDQALLKEPSSVPALYWRGAALYRLDRFEEAIRSFSACLAGGAKNPEALEARAACHYALKNWKLAMEDWEAVEALDPPSRGRLQPFMDAVRELAK